MLSDTSEMWLVDGILYEDSAKYGWSIITDIQVWSQKLDIVDMIARKTIHNNFISWFKLTQLVRMQNTLSSIK
jgi:hypothetical protein